MKKTYIIRKTNNGFIVQFDHLKVSFQDENLRIAKTLREALRIMKKDLEESKKAGTSTEDTLLADEVQHYPPMTSTPKEKREKISAVVTQRAQSIDFTNIYFIRLERNLKAGTVLRFDTAEKIIYAE